MQPVYTQIVRCEDQISREAPYLSQSFVLRLLEQTWTKDLVQTGVVAQVPAVLTAPRNLGRQVGAVKAGLDALLQRIKVDASADDFGDVAAFRSVCTARDQVADAAALLEHLAGLKQLHDSLHLLQVLGTVWLDQIPAPASTVSAPLQTLFDGVKAAAGRLSGSLPEEDAACCGRCLQTVLDAERRLATGQPDERDYAYAAMRAMLVHEFPLVDAAMFAVSRQFPLRSFSALFPDPASREAAIDLCDTIRRRLMEHSLWQATDVRLYAVEQSLVTPTGLLLRQLSRGPLKAAMFSLQVLLGEDAARILPPVRDAVTRFSSATDPDKPAGGSVTGSAEEVRSAFAALRDAARSAFLDADRALKSDFDLLLTLLPSLRGLLARVPEVCTLWLPPERPV